MTAYRRRRAAARQRGRPLGRYANNRDAGPAPGAPEEPVRLRRQRLRAHLWHMVDADVHRVGRCGRVRRAEEATIARAADGTAHYRGLVTCGSVTACPCCAAKMRQRRAEGIDVGLRRHLARGGGAAFATLTLPHDAGMPLEDVATEVDEATPVLMLAPSAWGRWALASRWPCSRPPRPGAAVA